MLLPHNYPPFSCFALTLIHSGAIHSRPAPSTICRENMDGIAVSWLASTKWPIFVDEHIFPRDPVAEYEHDISIF